LALVCDGVTRDAPCFRSRVWTKATTSSRLEVKGDASRHRAGGAGHGYGRVQAAILRGQTPDRLGRAAGPQAPVRGQRGQSAGFSLDEIAGLFDKAGRPSLDRAQLSAKADALDRTIRRLSALRDGLRHAAACPAPSHRECPTFQRLLKGAIKAPSVKFVEDLG
jgi:hypothetical protein